MLSVKLGIRPINLRLTLQVNIQHSTFNITYLFFASQASTLSRF